MKSVAEAVKMAFCHDLCAECNIGPIPPEAKFCPYCGVKLPDMSIVDDQYKTLTGWWLVKTEDGNGGWNIVGVYRGNAVELAFELKSFASRTLQFQPIPAPKVKHVDAKDIDISFPRETALARTDRSSRARLVRSIVNSLGMNNIDVSESIEFAAVKLTLKDTETSKSA